jgi:antitoxin ParD1/3/4
MPRRPGSIRSINDLRMARLRTLPRSWKMSKFRTMDGQPALDPQDEALIDKAIKSGRYASRAEVLREGLPVVRERQAQWARFEAEIQKGIDSLDRGEGIPLEEAFAEVRTSIRPQSRGARLMSKPGIR